MGVSDYEYIPEQLTKLENDSRGDLSCKIPQNYYIMKFNQYTYVVDDNNNFV